MKIKILFFDAKPYDKPFFDKKSKEFGFHIDYNSGHLTARTAALVKNYKVVCVFVNDVIDAATIDILVKNKVELIALRCSGYNNVDLKAAWQRIKVVRVPAYSPQAVAEHAVALMLTLNRKTHRAYFRTRDGNFSINGLLGFNLYQKTAGIIGTGQIGKCLINILRGFGMNILAYDKYPDLKYAAEHGFRYVELPELYSQADVISLHCPLSEETQHMIDSKAIAKMKKNVMLINTSRGKLIDTRALIKGLKSGKIGYAGLDVYEEESEYFFEDFSSTIISDDLLARLLAFNNVLVTSHQGFFTYEALENIAQTTLQNVKDYFSGKSLINEVFSNSK